MMFTFIGVEKLETGALTWSNYPIVGFFSWNNLYKKLSACLQGALLGIKFSIFFTNLAYWQRHCYEVGAINYDLVAECHEYGALRSRYET